VNWFDLCDAIASEYFQFKQLRGLSQAIARRYARQA